MRIKADGLDRSDTYTSTWFGGRGGSSSSMADGSFDRLIASYGGSGDVLDYELVVDRLRSTFGRGSGSVQCGGERVLDAQLAFGFADA